MFHYNIKIKSNNGEYSLESFDKDIIQREMDLYFASMYDASPEFKSQIKEIDISTKNYNTYLELQKLENVRENIVPAQNIQKVPNPSKEVFENQSSPSVEHFSNSAQNTFNQPEQTNFNLNQPFEYRQNPNLNLNNSNFCPVQPQNQPQNQNYANTIQPQVSQVQQPQPVQIPQPPQSPQTPQPQFLSNLNETAVPVNALPIEPSPNVSNEPQMPTPQPVHPTQSIIEPALSVSQFSEQIFQQPQISSVEPQQIQQISQSIQDNYTNPVKNMSDEIKNEQDNIVSENNVNIIFNDPESPASGMQIPPNHPDVNEFNEIMPDIQLEGVQNLNITQEPSVEPPQAPQAKEPEPAVIEQSNEIQQSTVNEIPIDTSNALQNEPQKEDDSLPQNSLLNNIIASSDILQQEVSIEQVVQTEPANVSESENEIVPKEAEPYQEAVLDIQQQEEEKAPTPPNTNINDFNLDNLKTDLFEKPKELKVVDYFENPASQEFQTEPQTEAYIEPQKEVQNEILQSQQDISPVQQDNPPVQEEIAPVQHSTGVNMPTSEQTNESSYFEDSMTQTILDEVKGRVDSLNLSNDDIDGDLLEVFEDDAPVIEFSRERIASVKKEHESGVQVREFGSEYSNNYDIQANTSQGISFVITANSAVENQNTLAQPASGEIKESQNVIDLNSVVKTDNQPEAQPKLQPQTTEQPPAAPVDFKTYFADNGADLLVDKFLICAYYIKNILNQESFTLKFINSKLFTATGEIANMTVVDELLSKNLINAAQSDSAKQYVISAAGEEYFTNNLKHS